LEYYAAQNFPYRLMIADSSQGLHLAEGRACAQRYQGRLDIQYLECPSLTVVQAYKRMAGALTTPYAVYTADDDFLILSGLQRALRFLQDNPEYSAAHGRAVLFHLDKSGPYGNIQGISRYRLGALEQPKAGDRLLVYLGDYFVNMFALTRRECWQRIAEHLASTPDGRLGGELWPCALMAVRGKVKQLDCAYLVRQGHDRRYVWADVFEWVADPQWSVSYKVLSGALAEEIMRQDSVGEEQAKEIVRQAFWLYMSTRLYKRYQQKYRKSPAFKQRIKNALAPYPAVMNVLKLCKNAVCPSIELSLPRLLSQDQMWSVELRRIHDRVTQKS
jgi:glycosyltransferase domain-containing protein